MTGQELDEEAIFNVARKIDSPQARKTYLEHMCRDDAAMQARVEALLQVHEQDASFLASPAVGPPATIDDPIGERPGTVIGPYKLIQQIGEGGMGTVYMAQQTEPVKRLVALKVVKPGMDSKQVIARFEAERQALALMDHPNIARVLDAGTVAGARTEGRGASDDASLLSHPSPLASRPFFVMELVKGVPITKYCDEHQLTPKQRLELFIPICQAIQHAHQKGIIHRDLKPSNVLIALYDGKPVPKVIDFGVAKAAGQQLTERTLVTEFGAVVGTLEYMSPEQAELNNQDIDTRSDIYSLGVLLYELLTGTTPLSRKRLKAAAFTEMLRMIREEEPPKPSTRLSDSKDALPSISARRHTEPAKLTRLVKGELDWIVMKALEKDRNRRYETANGLGMDLQRYLADEAVLACPPSAWYRYRKFARRHKVAFTTVAVVLMALVLGIIGTTWQAIRATDAEQEALSEQQAAQRERDQADEARKDAEQARDQEKKLREQEIKLRQEAEQQKERAEKNFAKARQAVDDYFTAVSESQLLKVSGMQELRRQLLLSALIFYERFLKERGGDPSIRAGVASAQLRVGKIRQELGEGARASRALQAARAGFEAALKDSPDDLDLKAGLAESWFLLAGFTGSLEKALSPHEKAIELREELLRARPDNARDKKELAESLNAYGIRLVKLKRHDEGLKAYRQCVTLRLELARDYPGDPAVHRSLFQSFNNIAVELSNRGHRQQALEMYLQANQYGLAAYAKMPHSTEMGTGLGIGYSNAGRSHWGLGQKEQGLREFQKAADLLKVLAQNNAAVPSVQSHYARALQALAEKQRDLGRSDDAARSLRLARGIVERYPREAALDLYNLACFRAVYAGLIGHGKAVLSDDEASERREHADQAMAALKQAVAKGYADVEHMKKDEDLVALRKRQDFKALVARLEDEAKVQALAKGVKGTPEQKLHLNEEVLAILQKLAVGDPQNTRYRANLATSQHAIGVLEMELGKLDEAARSLGQALAIREGLVNDDAKQAKHRADLAATHLALGNLHWRAGRYAAGARGWETGLALFDNLPDDPAQKTAFLAQAAQSGRAVATSYAHIGLYEETARHFAKAFERQPPDEAAFWRFHACFRLLVGDHDGYRSACAGMVERFGKSTIPNDWHCLATACTLAPKAVGEPARWIKLAEEFAEADTTKTWRVFYVGLASHRAGRHDEAQKQLQQMNDWAMSWPVLAMNAHQLGQAAEARRWLKKTDDWYEQAMRAALFGDLQLSLAGLYIWDRPQFLVLHREAKALIEGSAPPDPSLSLWQGRVYAKLGLKDQAQAHFQAAVAARPKDPEIWLARARVFVQLGEHDQAEVAFAKAIDVKAADPKLWIARGRYFAERGEHTKADADFAKAASLTRNELNKFLEAGWWVVGPYPHNLNTLCPPERDPDPSKAVAAADAAGEYRWQSLPTAQYGVVDLRALSKSGPGSAYALTYVFSPDERPATLRIGANGGVRLWLNGQLVHHNPDSHTWAVSVDRVAVTLRAGRNTLLAKVSPKGNTMSLAVRLGDNPVDRALTLNSLGLWEEACFWFAKAFEREQQDESVTVSYAPLLLFKGEREAYRRLCAQTLKPWSGWSGAMTCVLAPEGCPDPKPVLQVAEKITAAVPEDHWWRSALVMALYRAGRFEEAIQAINKANFNATLWSPVLAMAYHRLGKKEEAQRWLAAADENLKALTVATLYRTEGMHFYLFHREAKTLIEGAAPKDDSIKALLARAREQFNKFDKATHDYDIALLFEPDQARLWLARGRRHADLKQWEKADADLAKAIELTPQDAQAWKERGRVYAGLGKPDEAAAALAKARALVGAFVLLGRIGAAERACDTLADAVDAASDDDTIEVRKNGPFISQPIKITRPLTIRAGAGFRPVIQLSPAAVEARANLLETHAPLNLEGLELQLVAQVPHEREGTWQSMVVSKASLHVANCRLLFKQTLGNVVENYGAICELRNCEVICPAASGIASYYKPHLLLNIDNCCLVPGITLHYVQFGAADYTKESRVRLTRNTFVTQHQAVAFQVYADKVPGLWTKDHQVKPMGLETAGNIWDAPSSVVHFIQMTPGKVLPAGEAEASLPQIFGWHGARNLYAVGGPFLTLGIHPRQYPAPANPIRSLAEWGKYWGAAEPESIEGRVRYQGGDLLSRLKSAPEKLTADDFRLAKGSAGYRARKDGKDLGADVDLVGPGPAYERWRKTPDYRQWLEQTRRVAAAHHQP